MTRERKQGYLMALQRENLTESKCVRYLAVTLLQKYCKTEIKFDGDGGFAACNSKTYNYNHKNREFCRREIQSHQNSSFPYERPNE